MDLKINLDIFQCLFNYIFHGMQEKLDKRCLAIMKRKEPFIHYRPCLEIKRAFNELTKPNIRGFHPKLWCGNQLVDVIEHLDSASPSRRWNSRDMFSHQNIWHSNSPATK